MAVFENRLIFELSRGVKVFLNLEVGVTRGDVPPLNAPGRQYRGGQGSPQTRGQIKGRQQAEHNGKGSAARSDLRESGNITYEGILLPPRRQRPCGPNFKDDRFYLNSARKQADMLVKQLGLSTQSSLLDVGSGPGRLAIGILDRLGEIERYCGVDVVKDSIEWGSKYITSRHPNFEFRHIDVENTRYNPDAASSDSEFVFPFGEDEFDIITLYSVFTHMLTDGTRAYLKEFQRILRPEGRIYLTAFLEEGVSDVEENPEGYLGCEWKGALHCVRYDRQFFEELLDEAGFKLDRLGPGTGSGAGQQGQRGVYISKKG